MVNSLFLDHGTVPSVSGILLVVTPPDDSLDTPKMSSPSLSPLTTVKLSLLPVTEPSNCGTLSVFASTPFKNKVTPSGFHVFDSHHFHRTPSSSPPVGTSWSRSGTFLTANSSVITEDTPVTSTPSLSPDGSLCASGGRDGQAKLWDLGSEEAKPLHTLDGGEEINALCFSPNRYWLCAAAGPIIKIWDLEQKTIAEELKPEVMGQPPQCISICWSSDGQTLFSGYTDGLIRVWSLSVRASALL